MDTGARGQEGDTITITVPRNIFRLRRAVLAAAVLMAAAGCRPRERAVVRANRDQILLIGNGSEPKALDPHLVTGVTEHYILAALLEGLVSEDPRDLRPVPGVAASWDVAADGCTYTFHLRPDARWSNGDPVTAADFTYSFERMLTPALAAEYAYMLYPLRNAEAFHTGAVTDFAEVGARAADESTLVLELQHRTPYFLELLNHYSWWPVHPPTIEKFGGMTARNTEWTRPGNFVGNGPFILKSWEINRRIAVARNPQYWDAGAVRLQEIHFLPIDSAATEERAFRDGALHVTNTVPLHWVDYYRLEHPELVRFDPYLGTYFYRLNVTRPPLDDVRVRRALGMVIDRDQITRYILKAGQQPALHFTPPDTGGYRARAHLDADPVRARQLLAEAGFASGAGFPTLRLLYNTSEAHKVIAEAVQQMWKRELQVNVTLVNQEWKVYLDSVKRLDYDLARAAWIGDYNDPNSFLDMWLSNGGNNRTGWSDPEYDRLIAAAGRAADPGQRFEHFQEAEARLLAGMPVIPVYFYVRSLLIQPAVKGWYPNLLDHHPYKYVFLDGSGDAGR